MLGLVFIVFDGKTPVHCPYTEFQPFLPSRIPAAPPRGNADGECYTVLSTVTHHTHDIDPIGDVARKIEAQQ